MVKDPVASVLTVRTNMGSGCIAPLILNREPLCVQHHAPTGLPRSKDSCYPLNSRLGGPGPVEREQSGLTVGARVWSPTVAAAIMQVDWVLLTEVAAKSCLYRIVLVCE